jgi:hypothetical protein
MSNNVNKKLLQKSIENLSSSNNNNSYKLLRSNSKKSNNLNQFNDDSNILTTKSVKKNDLLVKKCAQNDGQECDEERNVNYNEASYDEIMKSKNKVEKWLEDNYEYLCFSE